MALSEREQQMLEDMEQALRAEDPRFASQMNGRARLPEDRRRYLIGGVGALVGLGLVLVGISWMTWVGVVGFALIVASVAYAVAPRGEAGLGVVGDDGTIEPPVGKRGGGPLRRPGRTARPSRPARPRTGGSFMERMEQRWDQRREGGGR